MKYYSIGCVDWKFCYKYNHAPLFEDLIQANLGSYLNAFLGGVIFNLANLIIVAAISIAGMSVAFPIGIGTALILGVFVNYISTPIGNPYYLFLGVFLFFLFISCNCGITSPILSFFDRNQVINFLNHPLYLWR